MKITSLSCPSCGGRLEPMNGNPQIMICEYCNSQFAIEKDVPVNVHIHSSPSGRQPVLREEPSSGSSVKTGIVVTLSLISIIVVNIMIFANIKKDTSTPSPFRIQHMKKRLKRNLRKPVSALCMKQL